VALFHIASAEGSVVTSRGSSLADEDVVRVVTICGKGVKFSML
jgi:hypothetical protein